MLNHTASSSPLPSEKRHFISLRPRPGSARASQPRDCAITTEGAPGTSAENFFDVPAVLVLSREEEQQVVNCAEAELFKQRGPARPRPLYDGERGRESFIHGGPPLFQYLLRVYAEHPARRGEVARLGFQLRLGGLF